MTRIGPDCKSESMDAWFVPSAGGGWKWGEETEAGGTSGRRDECSKDYVWGSVTMGEPGPGLEMEMARTTAAATETPRGVLTTRRVFLGCFLLVKLTCRLIGRKHTLLGAVALDSPVRPLHGAICR